MTFIMVWHLLVKSKERGKEDKQDNKRVKKFLFFLRKNEYNLINFYEIISSRQ